MRNRIVLILFVAVIISSGLYAGGNYQKKVIYTLKNGEMVVPHFENHLSIYKNKVGFLVLLGATRPFSLDYYLLVNDKKYGPFDDKVVEFSSYLNGRIFYVGFENFEEGDLHVDGKIYKFPKHYENGFFKELPNGEYYLYYEGNGLYYLNYNGKNLGPFSNSDDWDSYIDELNKKSGIETTQYDINVKNNMIDTKEDHIDLIYSNKERYVKIDGKTSPAYDDAKIFQSENGKRYGYFYKINDKWYCNINGKQIQPYNGMDDLGSSLYICDNGSFGFTFKYNNRWYANINNNISSPYTDIQNFEMMENGDYWAIYTSNNKKYLKINNQTIRSFDEYHFFQMENTKKYYFTYQNNGQWFVNINGTDVVDLNCDEIYYMDVDDDFGYYIIYKQGDRDFVRINRDVIDYSRGFACEYFEENRSLKWLSLDGRDIVLNEYFIDDQKNNSDVEVDIPQGNEEDRKTISILYTTDEHGYVYDLKGRYRAAEMYTHWKNDEQYDREKFLVLSGGDGWEDFKVTGNLRGEAVCSVFKAMNYDAITIGNHELDYNFNDFILLTRNSKQYPPYLAANIENNTLSQYNIFESKIFNKNGIEILVLGLSNIKTKELIKDKDPKLSGGYSLKSYSETFDDYTIANLSTKADITVLIVHDGINNISNMIDDLKSAGVDLVLTGHDHKNTKEEKNGLPVVNPGSNFERYARIDITYDKRLNKIENITPIIKENKDAFPDRTIKEIVNKRFYPDLINDIIFDTDIPIGKNDPKMFHLLLDSWLDEFVFADMAMINNGSIRDDIPKGSVNSLMLRYIFPFDNNIVMVTMTGDQIKNCFKNMADPSTLKFRSNKKLYDNSNISTIPLLNNKSYNVLITDYMLENSNSYNFKEYVRNGSDIKYLNVNYRKPLENNNFNIID